MTSPIRTSRFRAVSAGEKAHAVRVSVGLMVPGLLLVAVGRPDLIIYAVFGSFTGMYGRADSRALRLLHQSQGAVLLLAGTATGIALARWHAGTVPVVVVATLFAIGGSMVADFFALRPEGPFYGVFALGALAGVPSTLTTPAVGWLIAAGAAALAILIGLGSAAASTDPGRRIHHAVRRQRVRQRSAAFVHAGRYAIAVALAGSLAHAVALGHVNWAIAGAVVTLASADPRERLRRGLHRMAGTLAGLAVTALLLLPGLSPRPLALLVILLLFPTELFMAVNYALALSFFTPMIMVMTELADPIGIKELLTTRALGTVLGVLCGLAVNYCVRDRSAARRGAHRRTQGA